MEIEELVKRESKIIREDVLICSTFLMATTLISAAFFNLASKIQIVLLLGMIGVGFWTMGLYMQYEQTKRLELEEAVEE